MAETSPDKFHNYSLTDLRGIHEDWMAALADSKSRIAEVQAELTRRCGEGIRNALENQGKPHGSVTMETPDGEKVKGEIKQTVKWDGDALRAIAAGMPWETASHYFKIDFSVKESVFKALEPGTDLHQALTAARTTKLSDLSVSFAPRKG